MRVLVTGAIGFVGRHLCAALEARGHAVVAASRGEAGGAALPLDLQDALSLCGIVDVARPDAVAHFAAQAFVPASIADPWYTRDVNAGGTLRLIEAVRTARTAGRRNPRVLVVGSADVYGLQPSPALLTPETARPRPPRYILQTRMPPARVQRNSYAVAATAAYGLDVAVPRTFNHIGPGQNQRFAVASFAQQLDRARRRSIHVGWQPGR